MYKTISKEDNIVYVKKDLESPEVVEVDDIEVDIESLIQEKAIIETRAKEITTIIAEKVRLISIIEKEPIKKPLEKEVQEEIIKEDAN